jgi:hypothetical protein
MSKRVRKKDKIIYYNDEEWEAVQRRAAALKMRTGTYIRRISVHGEIKWYDFRKYHTLEIAVNAVGRNVDQIAKVANSTQSVYKKDVEELQEQMDQLRTLFKIYFDGLDYDLIE